MKDKKSDSVFDGFASDFAVIAYILGGCIAITYALLGSFANPDCGTASVLSGKIVAASNENGGVTLRLEGEPKLIRFSNPGKDRLPLTKALDNNRGNVANVAYRKDEECTGIQFGHSKRIYPISIEVNGFLLLTEKEVTASVRHERTMLVLSGLLFIGMGIYIFLSRRKSSN